MERIKKYWNDFLAKHELTDDIAYYECFCFGNSEDVAKNLLTLTMNGKKQATCSSLRAYELKKEVIPKIGDLSVVTDWDGNPKCVIKTTSVALYPFDKMTFDICKREGENDSLDSWKKFHKKHFKQEGKRMGYEFKENMLIIFEDFEVIHK